jgi:N-(5-amino-5-carboxypentanoyl)-L-cysteinyl-D-valine synthase
VIGHLQPDGAYSFFGWSFGGVLALEIALQLARAGEHIANLMLVDSFFNVGKAASDIGLPDVNAVVDPINGRYNPDADDLARLAASTGRVLLFKAAVPSRRTSGVEQTRLFEYYASSPYNNLDTLLPAASITVELMADETHFSWITNASLVASMTARIRELVRPRQEIVTVWRDRRTGDRND